ncbi:tetratricopeptide repeat protein [Nautilia sp.]
MKFLVLFLIIINIYGFEAVELYNKGDYKKAEKLFSEYAGRYDSDVARAYLAKTYYKEGKYSLAEELIKRLLKKEIPETVKEELKGYLKRIEGVKYIKAEIAAGLLYDSNLNYAKKKESSLVDMAHIEEALIKGYYFKNNLESSVDVKVQNRGYFTHPEYNYIYADANAYADYHAFVNTKLSLGGEFKTNGGESVYKGELFFYKKMGSYYAGPFLSARYYRNDVKTKSLGGGLRAGLKTRDFETEVALYAFYGDSDGGSYDGNEYKFDIKSRWHFSEVFLFLHYYYDVTVFNAYRLNMHYVDFSFNKQESRHIYFSIGVVNYYSLCDDSGEELRKYEVYSKFIYMF